MPRLPPKPKRGPAQFTMTVEYDIHDDDGGNEVTVTSVIENVKELVESAKELGKVKTALLELPNVLIDVTKE